MSRTSDRQLKVLADCDAASRKVQTAAKVTVELLLNVDTLRDGEKTLDQFLTGAEDDDRLFEYRVVSSDWTPYFPELKDAAAMLEP